MPGLKLSEFSDRELLHRVAELGDNEGWVTTKQFAEAVRVSHPNATQCVGTRFGWMRRFGILEKSRDRWRLTPVGEAVRVARLSPSTLDALETLTPTEGMEAMSVFGELFSAVRERPEGTLIRRAWRHRVER